MASNISYSMIWNILQIIKYGNNYQNNISNEYGIYKITFQFKSYAKGILFKISKCYHKR